MKSIFMGIRNILLWSYERGTWQYDLLCLLIIGAVFLLPGKFFGDRDRIPFKTVRANEALNLGSKSGETVREIAVSDLQDFLQKQSKAELMLNSPQEAIVATALFAPRPEPGFFLCAATDSVCFQGRMF